MNKTLLKKLRIISVLAAVAIMAVIFALSARNGDASDEMKLSLTSVLFSSDFDFALFIDSFVRKFTHFIAFAALAVPVYIFAESFKISEALSCIYSTLFTVLYAVSDEIHQYFVDGRSCRLDDFFVDSAGAICTVIIIHFIVSGLRRKNNKVIPNSNSIFLKLFSSYILNDFESIEPLDDETVSDIIGKSWWHKLLPIISVAMIKSGAVSPSSGIGKFLRNESEKHIYFQTLKTHKFLEVYRLMINAGAKPICVKGIICRNLYPDPDFRATGDEDIVVSDKDYQICADVLKKCGFVEQEDKANETGFIHNKSGLKIEVHKSLFQNYGVYSEFNLLLGDMYESSSSLLYEDTEILCPSADKHFLYLVLHAFKHFIGSGVGIRQVCDIAMLARENKINWAEIYKNCEQVGAAGFLNGVLVIANKYFGLDISVIKAAAPSFDENMNVDSLIDDLLDGGIYGSNSTDRIHSGLLTLNKYNSSRNDEKISTLFPTLDRMKKKYPFLNKYPIMLPIAWIMRLAAYTASEHDSSSTIKLGKKRIELMKELNIIK